MKQMKFTFKTTKATGQYRAFHNDHHAIKLDGREIGYISPVDFKIYVQVVKKDIMEDGNPNCPWKWIVLKTKSSSLSLKEAQDFIKKSNDLIHSRFNIFRG